jgi:hypothetical protein
VPSEAARIAQDGDVVEIAAGLYDGDVAIWPQHDLIIRGVGGRARMRATRRLAEDKGIWVIKGRNATVERAEFSGARGPERNGSGIRGEGIGLTLRECAFHHNEAGVLAGGGPESEIVVERSEFAANGFGDGQSHNIYVVSAKSFTLRASYSHHTNVGHNVKSRAATTCILYSRIMDEEDGSSSYGIDLCTGGMAFVIGNLLQKGARAENGTLVAFGAEGLAHPVNQLYVVNNTLVNDRGRGGRRLARALRLDAFVRVWGAPSRVRIVNNLFVGPGRLLREPGRIGRQDLELSHNILTDEPHLVDRERFDYHLGDGSQATGAGTDPGAVGGFSLSPSAQYVHPAAEEPRPALRPVDVGAYARSDPDGLGHRTRGRVGEPPES